MLFRSDDAILRSMENIWRLRNQVALAFEKNMGGDSIKSQIFVPAGRSYFTSLGKAVVAFEQSGHLDPITIAFGRLFTALRDRRYFSLHNAERDKAGVARRRQLGSKLFGGEIRHEKDKDFVETTDGRKIPFSLLSSGQQELLPLWTVLEYAISFSENRLLYIEEPEAHLFPGAQSELVEYLVSLVSNKTKLFITTHSPYVLSKINVLLKAGSLASSKIKFNESKINAVVDKAYWLKTEQVRAYAFIDNQLKTIIGSNNLINADYLDEVSNELNRDFTKLLEIEFEK